MPISQSPSSASLQAQLASIIFGGIVAGSSSITGGNLSTINNTQVNAAAAVAASAASAIVAATPGVNQEAFLLFAQQTAAIVGGLASGLLAIDDSEIAAMVTTAATCLAELQSAVSAALGSNVSRQLLLLQTDLAVRAFAGLAAGISTVSDALTGPQITTLVNLAVTSAAAIL